MLNKFSTIKKKFFVDIGVNLVSKQQGIAKANNIANFKS